MEHGGPAQSLVAVAVSLALLAPTSGAADAIVRNEAMLASTIAEYWVEPGRLRLELEIGAADVVAFGNLLPPERYARLPASDAEPADRPWSERLARFFENDLPILVDGGEPLVGRLLRLEPRERIPRDEITGEPIPTGDGADPEPVLFAEIEYALPDRPTTLTLLGPGGGPAAIGFVVYHAGVPVNDFRFLTPAQTLTLDWEDPWYSHFERRALRRQYEAPVSGFLYVEPYEVRKEIVARPRDLQRFVDLGLDGRTRIPVDIQPELKRRVAEFLRTHQPVTIDGRTPTPELARVNFLERTLRTSRVIEPPEELDLHSAILGVIFVYPTEGLPERVTMEWDLWDERIQRVPVAAVDQAGALPSTVEPDQRTLEWRNFLKRPELPTLRVLEPPPSGAARWIWRLRLVLMIGCAGLAASLALAGVRANRRRSVAVAAALLLIAGSLAWARTAQPSEARTRELVGGLLHNVYRAFDFRDEERIYDMLVRSVGGELLAELYLEVRRSLELRNQGGARAKVKTVEVMELDAEAVDHDGLRATASWDVGGSVGHWGHVHGRTNRYRARLRLTPVDGVWKLTGLDIVEQERIQ